MFDPPFYDIIFFLIPLLVNYFYLIPPFPPAPPPPRELKNDSSLIHHDVFVRFENFPEFDFLMASFSLCLQRFAQL